MSKQQRVDGQVTGLPKGILRLEGGIVLLFSVFVYARLGGSWVIFFLLFFVPDLGFLGYWFGNYFGALIYNAFHTYVFPVGLGIFALYAGIFELQNIALIWCAHIGFDRLVGYGLKYPSGFVNTHMGTIHIGSEGGSVKVTEKSSSRAAGSGPKPHKQ